jgi:hypothetical protein
MAPSEMSYFSLAAIDALRIGEGGFIYDEIFHSNGGSSDVFCYGESGLCSG